MRRQLKFAGEETSEAMVPGRHVTFRPQADWKEFKGEYVMLVDLENKVRGIALIAEVAEPFSWERIGRLGDIEDERTPYNTGEKLQVGLQKFYGPLAPTTTYCAIFYYVFLTEVPDVS